MIPFSDPFTKRTVKRYNLSGSDKQKLYLFNEIDKRNSIGKIKLILIF